PERGFRARVVEGEVEGVEPRAGIVDTSRLAGKAQAGLGLPRLGIRPFAAARGEDAAGDAGLEPHEAIGQILYLNGGVEKVRPVAVSIVDAAEQIRHLVPGVDRLVDEDA